MKSRMKNPVLIIPEAMQAMYALNTVVDKSGLPRELVWLVQLRASQINGCAVCLDMHARIMQHGGETDERINAVAAWHDAPYYTDAERAALALTEALTRMADRTDPIPDEVWQPAARQFNEVELSGLILAVSVINVWNRLNVATRQVAGEWIKSEEGRKILERHAVAQ
jgi:AhpD family alkylhydroperoxidase